jgi:hypothetical protein
MMIVVPLVIGVIIVVLWGLVLNYKLQLFGGIVILTILNIMDLHKFTDRVYLRIAMVLLGGIILLMFIPSVIFGKDIILIHRLAVHPMGCEYKLKQIADAIELYAKDNNGKYPEKLQDISPKYMVKIPRCIDPLKSKWAEAIYKKREDFNFDDYYYEKFDDPPKFVLICRSNYHKRLLKDDTYRIPMYDSNRGIVH